MIRCINAAFTYLKTDICPDVVELCTSSTQGNWSCSDSDTSVRNDSAGNWGIGISEYVNLFSDPIPRQLETGSCYFPVSFVSSA